MKGCQNYHVDLTRQCSIPLSLSRTSRVSTYSGCYARVSGVRENSDVARCFSIKIKTQGFGKECCLELLHHACCFCFARGPGGFCAKTSRKVGQTEERLGQQASQAHQPSSAGLDRLHPQLPKQPQCLRRSAQAMFPFGETEYIPILKNTLLTTFPLHCRLKPRTRVTVLMRKSQVS